MSDPDFAWLAEHGDELASQYGGKWIAVKDQEVVGVGETAPEAAKQAREKTGGDDFILEAIEKSVDVIYGGI